MAFKAYSGNIYKGVLFINNSGLNMFKRINGELILAKHSYPVIRVMNFKNLVLERLN